LKEEEVDEWHLLKLNQVVTKNLKIIKNINTLTWFVYSTNSKGRMEEVVKPGTVDKV
jgi:hypothetical protein